MTAVAPLTISAPVGPTVRISDLRQWVYCPRVAWFTLACPVAKLESTKMRVGREKEARLARLQLRRSLVKFGLRKGVVESNVSLHSSRLGLSGKLDLLVKSGIRRYPVEVKFTRGPVQMNHRMQLAGYGLLLEDLFGVPVRKGYIVRLPDDQVEIVELSDEIRAEVRRIVEEIREMMRQERTPAPTALLAKCRDCEFRNFCGDVE